MFECFVGIFIDFSPILIYVCIDFILFAPVSKWCLLFTSLLFRVFHVETCNTSRCVSIHLYISLCANIVREERHSLCVVNVCMCLSILLSMCQHVKNNKPFLTVLSLSYWWMLFTCWSLPNFSHQCVSFYTSGSLSIHLCLTSLIY